MTSLLDDITADGSYSFRSTARGTSVVGREGDATHLAYGSGNDAPAALSLKLLAPFAPEDFFSRRPGRVPDAYGEIRSVDR